MNASFDMPNDFSKIITCLFKYPYLYLLRSKISITISSFLSVIENFSMLSLIWIVFSGMLSRTQSTPLTPPYLTYIALMKKAPNLSFKNRRKKKILLVKKIICCFSLIYSPDFLIFFPSSYRNLLDKVSGYTPDTICEYFLFFNNDNIFTSFFIDRSLFRGSFDIINEDNIRWFFKEKRCAWTEALPDSCRFFRWWVYPWEITNSHDNIFFC